MLCRSRQQVQSIEVGQATGVAGTILAKTTSDRKQLIASNRKQEVIRSGCDVVPRCELRVAREEGRNGRELPS